MFVTCPTGFYCVADVLVSAVGDQQEFLRLFFDMTFFFFVIIILLAIIQGLFVFSSLVSLTESGVEQPFVYFL